MASHELLISAAHKSSGKTTLSIGLIRALCRRGHGVQPYKKGPDYIDPMWLARAADRACYNLDYNTQTSAEITALFASHDAGVRLVEGNKGLYDSIDVDGQYSNAALSRLVSIPVVLVLDTEGITRGVAPLLCGYRDFESIDIAGVILNKVASDRHEKKLVAAIERYTDIPVLGAIGRNPDLRIRERHLGLVPSNEHVSAQGMIDVIAAAVEGGVDLDRLLDVTRVRAARASSSSVDASIDGGGLTLAVARDEAFGFYYADDLDRLERGGVRLEFFSPLRDERLPECDGLFIGGGFPESFAAELSKNVSMRESVRRFCLTGGATYAECGGLMYLCRELRSGGESHLMAGVIPAATSMQNRPAGRGLVEATPTGEHPWRVAGLFGGAESVKAHEFHYSRLVDASESFRFAYRMLRGEGVDGQFDGIVVSNTLATYVHQRHTHSNPWLTGFVTFIRKCKGGVDHVDQVDRSRG